MAIMSKLTASYLAGLVDGEGYIGLMRLRGNYRAGRTSREFYFRPTLKIAMTDRKTIEWLYNSFGGTFSVRKAHHNSRESYCWALAKHQTLTFIEKIYPYLKTKRKQAELILQYPLNKAGTPLSDEIYNRRAELSEQIRSLNQC